MNCTLNFSFASSSLLHEKTTYAETFSLIAKFYFAYIKHLLYNNNVFDNNFNKALINGFSDQCFLKLVDIDINKPDLWEDVLTQLLSRH